MSDFKAKMHQIRFRLGLRPRPRWGSLQRSPDPLAGFKGAYFSGKGEREGGGREGEGKGGRGGKREGPPAVNPPVKKSWIRAWCPKFEQ